MNECNNFRALFPDNNRKVFLPVIYLTSAETEVFEVGKAITDGDADGVCLISHQQSVPRLIKAYKRVRETYNIPIVLNFLGQQHPLLAIHNNLKNCPPDGLWTDEGFTEISPENFNTDDLDDFYRTIRKHFPNMFLARSITSKHQQIDYQRVTPYMDLVVTSGSRTGYPPEPKKIKQMREALRDCPLAIASGITQENLHTFQKETDCFMVSSGLCETPDVLSPKRLKEFAARLRAGT